MMVMVMKVKVKVKVMIEIEPPPVCPTANPPVDPEDNVRLPRSNDFSREIRGRFSLLYLYFQDRKPMKCFRKLSNGKR